MQKVVFERVSLKNFRNHREMSFEFTNGFNMITGPNGSGKTTIFDAICWALYDITTKSNRKADSIINKRTGKDTSVILSFSIDDKLYEIRNYRKDTKHNNQKILLLKHEGKEEILSSDRKEINERIKQMILPYSIFVNSLMFSQYIDKSFTEMGDSEQKDIFDNILSLKVYDDYLELIKKDFNNTEELIVGISNLIKVLGAEKEKYSEIKSSCLDDEINIISVRDDNILKKNRIIELSLDVMKRLKPEFANKDEVETKIKEIERTITEKEISIKNIQNKSIEEEKSIQDNCNDKMSSELESILADLNKKIAEIENKISVIKSECDIEIEKIESKKKEVEIEYQKEKGSLNNNQLNVLREKYVSIVDKIKSDTNNYKIIQNEITSLSKEVNKMISELKKSKPICYACGQLMGKSESDKIKILIESKSKEIEDKTQQSKLLSDDIEKCKELLVAITLTADKLKKELENKNKTIEENKNNKLLKLDCDKDTILLEANKKINLLQSDIFLLKKEDDSNIVRNKWKIILSNFIAEIKKKYLIKIKEDEKELVFYKEEKNKYDLELKDLLIKEKEYNNLTIKVEESKAEIIRINKDADDSLLRINNKIKEVEDKLEKVNNNIKKETDSLERYQRKCKILEFWKRGFSNTGIKGILLDEAIPILNSKARELCSKINVKVSFSSQKALSSGELRNKFSVEVLQPKNLTDSRSDLSKGEGRLVDIVTLLSIRYLFERMYNIDFNILLFDEVLDSLDPLNVDVVLDILRSIKDKSVILTTHTLRDGYEANTYSLG